MFVIIVTVKSVQLQFRDNKVGCSNELVVHITLLLLPGHLVINNNINNNNNDNNNIIKLSF